MARLPRPNNIMNAATKKTVASLAKLFEENEADITMELMCLRAAKQTFERYWWQNEVYSSFIGSLALHVFVTISMCLCSVPDSFSEFVKSYRFRATLAYCSIPGKELENG